MQLVIQLVVRNIIECTVPNLKYILMAEHGETHGPRFIPFPTGLKSTFSFLHAPHKTCRMLVPSPPPSTSMDDEDRIWKLDASSISGYAIPLQQSNSPQYSDSPIYLHVAQFDIQVSQTLETHSFPYYLQIIITPRRSDPGLILLLPLDLILNIVISDHGALGQSLRFKLVEKCVGVTRQMLLDGKNPGRMYGKNEDDPFHFLGLLKFREFTVRNAGVGEEQMHVMNAWLECLKRNAISEYDHSVQILREGSDGVWKIIESVDATKIEEEEKMTMVLDEESESLGISSIDIPEDTIQEGGLEDVEMGQSQQMNVQSNGNRSLKRDTIDSTPDQRDRSSKPSEPISPPASSPSYRESPEYNHRQSYSPDRRQDYSSEPNNPGRDHPPEPDSPDRRISSDDTSPERDPDTTPTPRHPRQSYRSQSSSQPHQQSPSQQSNFILTGSNAIRCPNQPQALSSQNPGPRNNRRNPGMKRSFPRFRRFRPNNQRIPEHLLPVGQYGRDSFRIEYPRHASKFSKPYDSYRPGAQTRSGDRPVGEPLFGRISGGGIGGGGRRQKIPHIERRE